MYDGEVFLGEFVFCMMMMTHSRSRIQLPDNKHSQRDELCEIVSIVTHFRVTQTGVLHIKKKTYISLQEVRGGEVG
jgi:hypothetical protein